METVVIEVEAILNSRPIAPLSNDPNDEAALTPGHFLIGEPLTAQVDATAQSTSTTLAKRWELVSRVKHQFWKRWSQEYLNELQQRNKWQTKSPNLQLGTIVIIKENTPVMTWRLGKVIETYPGPDGVVRTATVKTATGVIKRAIHLLAPLPLEPPTPAADNQGPENASTLIYPAAENERPDNTSILKRSSASNSQSKGSPPLKRCNLTAASMLMLLALFFPLVVSQQVTYTQITSNPGLHFENIGKIKPITSDWNLLIYFELAPFHNELHLLINGTTALMKACKGSHLNTQCNGLITHFYNFKDEMESGLENLAKRRKRGAIDFVGNVANSLFGVLDSKYAEQMTDTINGIKNNEAQLQGLLRNQTSFLDSTLNLMKQTEAHTQNNFEKLNLKINRLMNLTNHDSNHRSQLILSLSIQLIIIADNLQKMHTSMITLLADTYHGRISPVLLTPKQFATEVDNIKANLPADLTLPVADIIQLYGIAKAHAAISNQHIICTLFVPLAHQNEYDLFYITPVPQPVNNTLVAVIPTSKMMALNDHRNEYFPMDETKLRDCSTLENDLFLCPNIQASYYKGAPIGNCEMQLFNNESDSSCNLEVIANNNVWYQLYKRNQWLFATNQQLKLSTVCKGRSGYQILQGTGLITLPAGCTMKNDVITIHGHQILTSMLTQSFTSSGMTFSHLMQKMNNLTEPLSYMSSIDDINRLQAEVRSQLRELPATTSNHPLHGLAVSYTGLALIVIGIIILLIKRILKKRANTHPAAPQPTPRSNWNISLDPIA